jgi:hypothetical protein
MASDGAAHAVAPGVPHGAFLFWLYGPPPPQQLTRVVLRLNPAIEIDIHRVSETCAFNFITVCSPAETEEELEY